MRWAIGAVCAAMLAVPAAAAWHEATTRHFIVYSDDQPAAVQKLANDLERFDAILRFFLRQGEVPGSEANKLAIYVLPDMAALQSLCGKGCANVGGFYLGRASGSVAFTPRRAGFGSKLDLNPRIVLFHEYGHHFLLGNVSLAFPAWFSEGFAEFVSTALIKDEETVLGAAANHRGYELLAMEPLPIERVFDTSARRGAADLSQLYARGWLLSHYLLMTPGGVDKLNVYLKALNAGTPSVEAARRAFGELKVLDRTLDGYLRARRMSAVVMPNARLPITPATIRSLSAGEAAMVRMRMESTRGVNPETAPRLYARAAPVAAAFPNDALTQGWFAEIAFDAEQYDAAAAAANRALAVDPRSAQALLYKSHVLQARALVAKSTDRAQWAEVRQPLLAANRLSNDNAAVLAAFYESFLAQGTEPSHGARAGLLRAQQLVPQDETLRFLAARQYLVDGDTDGAKHMLRPLAFQPHGSGAQWAQRTLKQLDEGRAAKDILADLAKAQQEARDRANGKDEPSVSRPRG